MDNPTLSEPLMAAITAWQEEHGETHERLVPSLLLLAATYGLGLYDEEQFAALARSAHQAATREIAARVLLPYRGRA